MNRMMKPLALSAIALAITACSQQEPYPVSQKKLESEQEKQAYALGSSVGSFVARNLDDQEKAEVMLDRQLVIAGFVDAGNVSTRDVPGVSDMRAGAGFGVRYDTLAGPLRIDIATPLDPTDRDDPVQVYISLGQAF